MTTIKIVSHIERIGDHAKRLARAVTEIPEEYMAPAYPRLKKMADIGISMFRDSLDAFVKRDAVKAEEAAKRDKQIDEIHGQLYHEIIEMMEKYPTTIEYGSTLLFLNRFMERLGDHVIHMCDWVCYANTGKRMELS
jgi:phosphate transport system protein